MELNRSFLTDTETLLRTEIAPNAAAIDQDAQALDSALQTLGQSNLLALRVPQQWGGAAINEVTFRSFQELVARYSGALAFLQAQHQSAGSLLAQSENESLKQAYLPLMGTGQHRVGISFAHLRREHPPVKALEVAEGYVLNGQAPWVTGWGIFQTFIAAAVLPNGEAVYGMVPFQTTGPDSGGEILCSEPMSLAAMTATNTVTVQFQEWFLPRSQVVCIRPASAITRSDQLNVLQHSFFALGCARAGLDILAQVSQAKRFPFLDTAYQALAYELEDCRQAIFAAPAAAESFQENVQLRARAIELAVRCAHAAIAAASGAATSSQHPAQRIYREALTFTVAGQTQAVMEATLDRLVRPNQPHSP